MILVSSGARTMQSSAAIAILITIVVGAMNNIRNAAEEILFAEVIYA